MSWLLQWKVDYAHFVCGMVLILIGITAQGVARLNDRRLAWRWLGAFGWIRGIHEWLEVACLSMPAVSVAPYVRMVFLILSYLSLAEFARASFARTVGLWIYGVALMVMALATAYHDIIGIMAAILWWGLCLPSSIWAASAIWKASKGNLHQQGSACLRIAAILLLAQTLVMLWMRTQGDFGSFADGSAELPHTFLNLLSKILLIIFVLALWKYYGELRRRPLAASVLAAGSFLNRLAVLVTPLVLIIGWLTTNLVDQRKSEELRAEILNRTKIAAATIDTNLVRRLQWSDADIGQPYYETLKAQLMAIRQANADLVFVSLMGIRDGKSYVLVDSEPPESEDYSPPGQYYEEADPQYNRLLAARVPFVIGPLYDRWGSWITSAAPITEVGPPPAAVALALDLNASHWNMMLARTRLPVILITLLIAGLVLSFLVAQQRAHETTSARIAETERIARQKRAIVQLATSPRLASVDFKDAAQEITEVASEALQVERVSLWLGNMDEGQLTCVDQFEHSGARHTEGQLLQFSPYPHYFEALATGRAIDAHDAPNDPRTAEFRHGYLDVFHITSMLDAPIRISGRIAGVLCFEHTGLPRTWTEDEIRFAAEAADQAAQALSQIERRKAEEEKHKLEQQIQYSQKLESLGVLAGGIAHDFNNMLMVMLGNIELALSELPPVSSTRLYLQEVESVSRRAADLCRQLLAYAGKGQLITQPIDLNTTILDMQNMIAVSVSKKAILRYELAPRLPAIEADATQIQQVVMNLVINASESLEDREGTITISTSSRYFTQDELHTPWATKPQPEGEYVVLQISDTGCGMTPEVQARIFEPFFSTKFLGRGLGLAAVLGIVQGHNATIRVYSEHGKGSVFRVLLPASGRTAIPSAPTATAEHWKTSGTVLIVEDEEAVRRVTANMLEACGLKVLSAADGREALDTLRKHSGDIKCVLLDLTMPRMDGAETLHEIRKICSDIPVILASGYTEEVVAERLDESNFTAFIEKPYSRARLIQVLKQVLNGP